MHVQHRYITLYRDIDTHTHTLHVHILCTHQYELIWEVDTDEWCIIYDQIDRFYSNFFVVLQYMNMYVAEVLVDID